ncbi:MAG: nitrogenase iron-molybdenum cofactor biosynthesis protein NifE, partial [Treponema sp. GWB1_62_6]
MGGGFAVLEGREGQVSEAGEGPSELVCGKPSLAGSVSQRACVFCGSRVVLYPVADAVHLVHGPVGCAAYTWDIRGAVSTGPQLHRLSFSTDLRETDVVFGGEKRLYASLSALILEHAPRAAFVYSTCIVGLIGDDVAAVCRQVSRERGIPVLPVHSEGFKGTKKDGYRAACDALSALIGTAESDPASYRGESGVAGSPYSINILGEFNLAGEAWIIRRYYERMGIRVQSVMTGDGRVDEIRGAHRARLNVVQCSGSMTYLAKDMKERYGIPFIQVSYFGIDDMAEALYAVATAFPEEPALAERAAVIVAEELAQALPALKAFRKDLEGMRAAIYVGGAFKARSLVKALRLIGVETVLVGSQTGNADDYRNLSALCDPGTIIVDDSNPAELSRFLQLKGANVFIGGVKERPIAYKLGIGFCDHNHERKIPLAGFEGMVNFAREVHASATSPVWKLLAGHGRSGEAV